MKTGIIIQARMSSTRLPGKIALKLPYGGKVTVLEQVIARAKMCRLADEVIVATTTGKEDNLVVRLAKKAGAKVFRGSKDDVLSRYFFAAKNNSLDIVVRVTSDCPFIDPAVIGGVVRKLLVSGADYASNTLERTFPHGLDAEAFTFQALERAHFCAKDGPEREHVTLFIYRRPADFVLANLKAPANLRGPEIRVTVDTPEDYALACAVSDLLPASAGFGPLAALFSRKPWLRLINARVVQKKVYKDVKEEFREAARILQLQDLLKAAAYIRKRSGK